MTQRKFNLNNYKTFIFDCDGVILDSNPLKTKAFEEVASLYGAPDQVRAFIRYHQERNGISRFIKFRYFFENILGRTPPSDYQKDYESCLELFHEKVLEKLKIFPVTPGFFDFMESLPPSSRKIIISGTAEVELQEVFKLNHQDHLFNAIYGSPRKKTEILTEEKNQGLLKEPALFIGDSSIDYEAAAAFKIDFVFLSQFTEFFEWKDYFKSKDVFIFKGFTDLNESLIKRSSHEKI